MPIPEPRGVLLIDKPSGISSFAVIKELRRITGIKKIGHSGTLDPFANGLLVCLLGSYTRLASISEAEDKSYAATVQLGHQTNTGDPEGELTASAEVPDTFPDWAQISSEAMQLKQLPVPAFSAIKINGKRAYKYAREEFVLEMPIRPTTVTSFQFIPHSDGSIVNADNQFNYCCTVSKGTYIRSLSEWLAKKVGSLGYTIYLRRTSIGSNQVESAVPLADLNRDNWQSHLCSYHTLVDKLPVYHLSSAELQRVVNGNAISQPDIETAAERPVVLISPDGDLVALGRILDNTLKPYLVMP